MMVLVCVLMYAEAPPMVLSCELGIDGLVAVQCLVVPRLVLCVDCW
jgi:hypothetical protein